MGNFMGNVQFCPGWSPASPSSPSSLSDRSSILIFCSASSSSAQRERSFSRASFMSPYCSGTTGCGGSCGASAPLVVVPTSSRRRPNIPLDEMERGGGGGVKVEMHRQQQSEGGKRRKVQTNDASHTFFFLVGWSILACKKSISLVCWEMVPSIFTFSWEYTACKEEG